MKEYLIGAALPLTTLPVPASADWLFTPSTGTTFGGDTSGREHFTYGTSLAWMGRGIFGWEVDVSFTPEFLRGQ